MNAYLILFIKKGSIQSVELEGERLQIWHNESLLSAGQICRVRSTLALRSRAFGHVDKARAKVAGAFTLEEGSVVRIVRDKT